ncbi:MAG: OmpA family protein [Paludibacteraceae bacterium]|nr:OmpA family protein [Paludibacteraceae bacterium]
MRLKLIVILSVCSICMFAQNSKAYMNIVSALQQGDTESAVLLLEKQVKSEKKESEWYKMLDDTYKYNDRVEDRILLLEKAVKVKNVKELDLLKFRLSIAYFDAGRYDDALTILNALKQNKTVKRIKANCESAKTLKADSVSVDIVPMSDSINTPYDNIWPLINNDKTRFYTTVVMGKSSALPKSFDIQEDIFCSRLSNGKWMPVSILQGELRSKDNEGACSITADGKYLFFAACNRKDGGGGCEIYYSIYKDGRWSKPIRAQAPLNKFSWQSTPSICSDGKTLYFSAVDDKGTGKDIYKCSVSYNKDESLAFDRIMKLGSEINTDFDEISPFISPYDNILYFSSDGHGGMGGLDIYYSKRKGDGSWDNAKNIGYPINTHRDEFGFVTDVDGRNGYLSCNGLEHGEFWQNKRIVCLKLGDEHRVDAPFELKKSDFIMENIYFDFDSSVLTNDSFTYLDAFAKYLSIHPSYSIVISGHTDNKGEESYNIALSKARAESVASYLFSKGVDKSRITTEGLGSSKPIAPNDTEDGCALNRRIEVSTIYNQLSD